MSASGVLRKLAGLWERAAIYLPLVLMGLLALGTYWLARNTPVFTTPSAVRPENYEIDYFMRSATVRNFDEAGRLKSEIFGVEARHFPATEMLEIDQVRARSVGPQGHVTVLSADRGLSNDKGSEVRLMGSAVVVREPVRMPDGILSPRLEFRGEFLHVFVNEDRVQSHLPVTLIRGNDQFTSDAFSYNNLDQVADLKGRVKGILMPRAAVSASPLPKLPG